jgi:hypothetical protein
MIAWRNALQAKSTRLDFLLIPKSSLQPIGGDRLIILHTIIRNFVHKMRYFWLTSPN